MKVILGPLPCRYCGSPVTIVRRDVVTILPHDPVVVTIPDAEWVTVDEDGTRHECSNG